VQRAENHLPDWTLDLLAEDALSHSERSHAEAHLRSCARCRAEMDAARAVIAELDALPRFEPSAAFADAVMARVVVAPAASTAVAPARSRRWLPKTRRGWMMVGVGLLAPLGPLAALLAWVLGNAAVTPGALAGTAGDRMRDAFWSALARATEAVVRSPAFDAVADLVYSALSMSSTGAGALLLFLAITIPASGWTLVRLLRTPTGGFHHAH
jgi:hypothetical protein